jgi:hypothetical protein
MRPAHLCVLLLAAAVLVGCASTTARPDTATRLASKIKTSVLPPGGLLYTDYKAPLVFTPGLTRMKELEPIGASREGSATAFQIGVPPLPFPGLVSGVDLVAWGDASVEAAAKSNGINEIKAADYRAEIYLSIFRRTTVYVYGD